MKTPRNSINALFHGRLRQIELSTLCTVGLLGRWRPTADVLLWGGDERRPAAPANGRKR